MKERIVRVTAVLALIAGLEFLQPIPGRACSAFVMTKGDRVLFGRNFDFFTGLGFVTTNPRNTAKTALVFPGNTPAQWVSKYGSVSFNQIGRDFPMGGMNEAGLVVECLWLFDARYPAPDARPGLTELQWIQYQLDNCRTVEDVLASDSLVRIVPSETKLHFLVCDRTGKAGVVEFIGGKSVLYGPDRLPVKALANNSYQQCAEALKTFQGFGGTKPIPDSPESTERFARMATAIRNFGPDRGQADIEDAFRILKTVRYEGAESPTQWSIIYDPTHLEIHFETRDVAVRRTIKVGGFDFACAAAVKVLDLEAKDAGDVTKAFADYSAEANREHTRSIFGLFQKAGYAQDIPEIAVAFVGAYPESTRCQASAAKSEGTGSQEP